MMSVAESGSFYNTRECSTRTQTIFGKEGPNNFVMPGPIFFFPDLIFYVTVPWLHGCGRNTRNVARIEKLLNKVSRKPLW